MAARRPDDAPRRRTSGLLNALLRRVHDFLDVPVRARSPRGRIPRALFEPLEPKVMMSVDLPIGLPVVVSDTDGTVVTVRLSGPGEGQLDQIEAGDGGNRLRVRLSHTTAESRIDFAAAGGDGRFYIDAITVTGALGGFAAGAGVLTGAAEVADTLGSLSLAAIAGGRVQADAIGTLSISGDFTGNLTLGGETGGLAMTTAVIGGGLDGHWNVQGRTGSIRAGVVADGWSGAFAAPITSLTTLGDFGGTLHGPSLQQLTVGGNLADADLFIGANLGSDGRIGGSGDAVDTFGAGNLNRVRVNGAVSGTRIRVGVDPVNGVFDDGNDAPLGASRIQEFLVGGDFSGSTVVAGTLPAQVRVHGALLPTASVAGLSNRTRDDVAPVLLAALAHDTGSSATDRLTSDATVVGSLVDAGQGGRLVASFGSANVDVSDVLAEDGTFVLDRSRLDAIAGGPLADGAHRLRLTASDGAGNDAEAVEIAFSLDTAVAGLDFALATADALDGDNTRTAAANVLLRGTTEAGATIRFGEAEVLAGGDGVFVLPDVALALGDNAILLTSTDAAGNARTLTRTLVRTAEAVADPVLAWNGIALRAIQLDVTDPPVATRTLAMLSLAQYDTLAAIEGTPAYLVRLNASGADAKAALATAAHGILGRAYPAQKAVFDAALASELSAIAEGAGKDAGIALGVAVSEAIGRVRAVDGSDVFIDYLGSETAGKWRATGPMFAMPDEPQWADVSPFALQTPGQLRPEAPPALDSAVYAVAVNEIKSLGSATGSGRTDDQTQTAHFWADGKGSFTPPGHWNQIAAQVAVAEGNGLAANVRLFAQLNVALADAAIACWDAKYFYELWRPESAIRNADQDGNAATEADAGWTPLLITPAHPEYVSGHSTFSAAAAAILAATFGDDTAFATTSATLPGVTRSFGSFSDAAEEAGRSRVYGGIHYEFTNRAGQALGRQVADAVLQRFALNEDRQGPAVSMAESPVVASTAPVFAGQVIDNLSGVAGAQVRIDGGASQALALDALGRFSIAPTLATNGSDDGIHTVTVSAVDAAGNASTLVRTFRLDTRAPVVSIDALPEGSVVTAATRLAGTADGTGSSVVSLRYSLGGSPERTLVFDPATGIFDEALSLGVLPTGEHELALRAVDAAGNVATLERTVTIAAKPLLTLTRTTPVDGAGEVGVTFRPQATFSRAVDIGTLTADSFYATGPDGQKLAATIVPAQDGTFAWLFFQSALPGGSTITLHIVGDLIRAASDGAALDADADGVAGGHFASRFTTVSTAVMPAATVTDAQGNTTVVRTSLVGKVVDPGADLEPMTFDDIRRGPDGVIHTADDVFLNPIAHAKVWVLGQEDRFVYTDAQGRFELLDVPTGNVKLAVDGRTATNAPSGVFWPEMVMDLTVEAGVVNTVMGTMGKEPSRRANADRPEVYLPRIAEAALQDVSATEPTTITVGTGSAPQLTPEERAALTLTVTPGSAIGLDGRPLDDVRVGISTVPSELVRDMLPPGVLEHQFDITIQAPGVAVFTTPLRVTFPNVEGAAPGTKLNIMSFDHTTGRLVISGTATVSADGKTVVSDEGSGIQAPGWHWLTRMGAMFRDALPGVADFLDDPCVNFALKAAGFVAGGVAVLASSPAVIGVAAGVGLGLNATAFVSDILIGSDSSTQDAILRGGALAGKAIGIHLNKVGNIEFNRVQGRIDRVSDFGSVSDRGLTTAEIEAKQRALERLETRRGRAADKFAGGKLLGLLGLALSIPDLWKSGAACFEDHGGAGARMALMEALTHSAHPLAAELEASGMALLEALDYVLDPFAEAFDLAFGDALNQRLAGIEDETVYLSFVDDRVLVSDTTGAAIMDTATGMPLSFTLDELLDPDMREAGSLSASVAALYGAPPVRAAEAPPGGPTLVSAFERFLRAVQATTDDLLAASDTGAPVPDDLTVVVRELRGGNVVYRGAYDALSGNPLFLAAGNGYTVEMASIQAGAYGMQSLFVDAGRTEIRNAFTASSLRFVPMVRDLSIDSDGDGVSDAAEAVFGTHPARADSDGDGVSDLAELRAQTDPQGGRTMPIGVVGSLPMSGEANALAFIESTGTDASRWLMVAAGTAGVGIVDVSSPATPRAVSNLRLAGSAVDVAVDAALRVAAVASQQGGLHLIDVSQPLAPRLVRTVALNATSVEVFEGIAYVVTGSEIRSYDLLTGERLDGVSLPSPIRSLARDGNALYVTDTRDSLRLFTVESGLLTPRGSLRLPADTVDVAVGGGIAYVGAGNGGTGGMMTVDVTDADRPVLISGVDSNAVAGTAVALNGSGLAVVAGSSTFTNGFRSIDVLDVRNPADTARLVSRIALPQAPRDVVIGAGMAFVAGGTGGLHVVNYLSADARGVPPVVTADFDAWDVDASTPGIQMLEGRTITVRSTTADDVQVRNVELIRNGSTIVTDSGFPFELTTVLPTLAANGGATTVTLQVRATDTGGNFGLSPAVTVELVPDVFAPTLVSSNISEGSSKGRSFRAIDLVFSEALDAASVTPDSIRLIGPDGLPVESPQIQFRRLGREVQLTYSPLAATGPYRLVIDAAAVTDRAGNPLGDAPIETGFILENFTNEWIGSAGGFWDVAANWSAGSVPTVDDDVFVGGLPAGASITFRSGTTSVATLTSDAGILVTGGTLTVVGEAAFRGGLRLSAGAVNANGGGILVGSLDVAGGTFSSGGALDVQTLALSTGTLTGEGAVTVAAASSWSGGAITGSGTLTFVGDLSITGAGEKVLSGGRVINTFGTTTWSGATTTNTNDFYTGPATINNAGLWIDANAASTIVRDWYSGNALVFNNAGTYRKQGNTTSTLEATFHNTGTVEVQAGVLSLSRGGSAGAEGSIRLDAGATLRFNAGTFELNDTTVTGTGTFQVAGTFDSTTSVIHTGTTTLAGQLSLVGGTLFANGTLNAGSYAQTANYAFVDGTGTVDVAGAATWSDGNLVGTGTINFRGDLSITGAGDKAISGGRVIHLYGTTTWSGATAVNTNDFYTGPGTIHNHGTFVDDNAFNTIVRDWYSGSALVFDNAGTYRKTSANVSRLEWVFDNSGVLDVDAGTLQLVQGGSSTGQVDLAASATLDLLGGEVAWRQGATFGGEGRLLINGADLELNAPVSLAHLTLAGGSLTGSGEVVVTGTGNTWTAGFMTGGGTMRIAAGADLTVSGASRKYLGNRTLDVQGTLIEASTGDLMDLEGAATLKISGVMDIRGDTAWQQYSGSAGTLVIDNAGTLRKSAGTGQFEFLNASLTSTGTVQVTSGTLRFSNPIVQNGTVLVDAGATLILGTETILGPFPTPAPLAALAVNSNARTADAPSLTVAAVAATPLLAVVSPLPSTVAAPASKVSDSSADERAGVKRIRASGLTDGKTIVSWRKDLRDALRPFRWSR
ncbi:MAG: Ig-like domain-containing protein [Burkholderiales bacterium]